MDLLKTYEYQLKLVFLIGFTIGCYFLYKNNNDWLNSSVRQKWHEDLHLKIVTLLWMFMSALGGGMFILICLIEGLGEIERRFDEIPWWTQLFFSMCFILFIYTLYIWIYEKKPTKEDKNKKLD
jgi:uncharacterized BrkB/YihY/UPF0761 family membrane protein